MDIIREVWKIVDKYKGKHSHEREKARRRRQMERGVLPKAEGVEE